MASKGSAAVLARKMIRHEIFGDSNDPFVQKLVAFLAILREKYDERLRSANDLNELCIALNIVLSDDEDDGGITWGRVLMAYMYLGRTAKEQYQTMQSEEAFDREFVTPACDHLGNLVDGWVNARPNGWDGLMDRIASEV
ncbi:hypothetical protein ElyMa_004522900 [Elysia marginata]|uniref:Uncharacterized protein n=1 Tax=Elysia marginata TaxID=1093978 RepID=A0AAV4HPI2_9GAST|nr:hypothetical protein ElyMa_004522900 [Elysia marginata]